MTSQALEAFLPPGGERHFVLDLWWEAKEDHARLLVEQLRRSLELAGWKERRGGLEQSGGRIAIDRDGGNVHVRYVQRLK